MKIIFRTILVKKDYSSLGCKSIVLVTRFNEFLAFCRNVARKPDVTQMEYADRIWTSQQYGYLGKREKEKYKYFFSRFFGV